MRYSREQTLTLSNHIKKDKCLEYSNDLLIREGYLDTMPVFDNDEIVLDMDCVEHQIIKGTGVGARKSMDCAFVITNADGTLNEILFVEFKFNVKNLKQIDKWYLLGKIAGSKGSLSPLTNIHHEYLFIFKSKLKEQARRKFYMMNPRMDELIARDIHELKELYF
jgi:hypothetical protein